MALHWEDWLFRLYILWAFICVCVVGVSSLIDPIEKEDVGRVLLFLATSIAVPWAAHYFIKWILNRFRRK